jgi:FkbM family methyltransferase
MNPVVRIPKAIFRSLPIGLRRSIRARRLEHLVRSGRFHSDEPEYERLQEWLRPGDIALDVGANFGSYTMRMSKLVGETGRVFAFEPVPQTFHMLMRALAAAECRNVTALNVACSDENGPIRMVVPDDSVTGENLYGASITGDAQAGFLVYRMCIDQIPLPKSGIKVVKVDAEGHDHIVIAGMWGLLESCMPVLITEHPRPEITARLEQLGYVLTRSQKRSPNGVFIPPALVAGGGPANKTEGPVACA